MFMGSLIAHYWHFMNWLDIGFDAWREAKFDWFISHFQWMKQNWREFQFTIAFFFVIGICCGVAIMLILHIHSRRRMMSKAFWRGWKAREDKNEQG